MIVCLKNVETKTTILFSVYSYVCVSKCDISIYAKL